MSDPARLPQTVVDVLESMTDACVVLGHDLRYLYANRRAMGMLGDGTADVTGRHVREIFPEGFGPEHEDALRRALDGEPTGRLEAWFAPLGRWLEARMHPSEEGVRIFFQDVTDRKEAERELERREQRYRVLAHSFASVVWSSDAQGIARHSESWTALTGRQGEEGRGDTGWAEAIHADDRDRVGVAWSHALECAEEFDATYRMRVGDGSWRTVRARGVPVLEDGRVVEWIGVIDDLTEQVRAEELLRRAALEDPLTALPNRAMFVDRLAALLAHRRRRVAAVLYVDVDRFKAINDSFGHAGGDRVLRTVAARLRETVRPSDLVARLSGDEFAILCDELDDVGEALAIARRLAQALRAPVEGMGVEASAAIGIAEVTDDDTDAEAVLRAADAAMYEVKSRGGDGVEVFDAALRDRLHRRAAIEEDLRRGLDGEGLQLHFQPVLPLRPDAPRPTAEALLRFRSCDGSVIPAPEAIAVAERSGLILHLGANVLRLACEEAAAWTRAGIRMAVSVNVSARQVAQPDRLVADVAAALERSGLAPRLLRLEITESVVMEETERAMAALSELRALGTRIVIDDFGVGYSSLSYLHRLPFDAVKIDRSFVARLPEDAGSARIVEAVVGVARAFGAKVIAEGVERRDQLEAVRDAGCDGIQGYGAARPVPVDELVQALDSATRWVNA